MRPVDLETLRRAGRISATALAHGKVMIKPGARLEDIARACEQVILDMGGKPAFPAQLSRNHIAAHYCSAPGDVTEVKPDDIIQLDLGTQVDGYVTDNATTVDLRDGENSLLVAASRMALDNAISVMGPGVSLTEVGRVIESTVKELGFNPVYNLTGHGVARYVIHCAPAVPNYPDPKAARLRANMTIACEPFVCDGRGQITEQGTPEVFMLRREIRPKDNVAADIVAAVAVAEGLPFARRQLISGLRDARRVNEAIEILDKKGLIHLFPPLCEREGVRVAQSEHTIFISEDGAEVITRLKES